MTQEEEYTQMKIEKGIIEHLNILYQLLLSSDRIEAEEQLGHIAQFKEFWEDGTPINEQSN